MIPLGVHSQDFSLSKSTILNARRQLDVGSDEVVVLFLGRLSFHGKAHPLAMYQALEQAALSSGRKVTLVECGWFANDAIRKSFSAAASYACPSVRSIILDGRDPKVRTLAWACADIFCSLTDNIQETFGITPIEAMAAGMPVVVSDWDGYRDTVRHGIDGFCIPTRMPPPGYGSEFALRHDLSIDTYDMYCGYTSSLVSLDLQAATQAFIDLISSRELRRTMGENGRQRVAESFDWNVIIPRYESLWAELNSRRVSEASSHTYALASRLDPFYSFASYPSRKISSQTSLRSRC